MENIHNMTGNVTGQANGLLQEFKEFAMKGDIIDLAVGVVIGTAFSKIVDSLVNDVIMQAIAMIFKQPDFSTITIGAIKIGSFLNNVISFLIIAFSVFMTIKFLMKYMPKKA